ncbi:hypothetical protein VF14_31850 [Nostoc linckia z18]|uniref:Uncharacterized protein n=2 Tax=Nostoc linckia TaxID=92942 RepID=A0A9Q6EHQ0_NOSLI|nr:hypothetical protein [Nostoc linckia]PHK34619.1 hypothetical protein VF12_23600 [Nostoc linckia z15]PHK41182.1 hypothetical protein VF13_31705 [Nostoc linckia z16]PHJ55790.1 hypothetical protein VF02_35465 [Nostoc linckia z1]PHJ57004.1 hypothetical protein VF05_36485 [Nostoc linckia z3]PHJ58298.1 hypothetical protein VF03_35670 [Nostoc linckia z2]
MAQSVIRITLECDATQAENKLNNLSKIIEGNLGNSFQSAAFNSQLMIKGIEAGISAITGLVGKLSDGLSKSIAIQSENISVAGNIMKLTGQNYAQATEFIDEFSNKMSVIAAALPGQTSDYVDFGKAIADDVIPALKGVNGAVDIKKLQSELQDVSKLGTLLAQSANVKSTDAAMALSKFLGGTSSKGELSQLDFFQKNTTFRNSLFQEIEKLGKDVKQLTVEQRLEIFKKAAAIPQEVLDAQSKSLSGIMAGFTSSLFDPQTGLFGWMRDLNLTVKGNQSALSAIQEGVGALIGENGLLNAIGGTLKAFGFEAIDPMLALRNVILGVNAKIKYLRDVLNNFLNIGQDDLTGRNFRQSSEIERSQGERENKLANDLNYFFNQVFNIEGLGKKLASLTNSFFDQIANTNWSAVGAIAGEGLARMLNEAFRYINNIDWGKIGSAALEIGKGLFIGIGKFLTTLDWIAMGQSISVLLLASTAAAAAAFLAPVIAGVGSMGAAIAAAIVGFTSSVVANWENLKSTFANLWQSVVGAVNNFVSSIRNLISNFKLPSLPSFGGENAVQAHPGFTQNFASGNTDLLNALIRENRQAPPGSRPVIANSSEAILTREQQKQLLANSNNGIILNGDIVINGDVKDPNILADEIINRISIKYQSYKQSRMFA